ncbi:hypothetical protein BX600DRAFT_438244 [Xylariales sp. PMI_506]|nr:hypothetical protein BX600DRAFT_438244 [Xylariales sp. PMI_506]
MFEVRHAGAKGFGIFASRRIARGSRILAERPLLSVSDARPDILAAARSLSHESLRCLLQLSQNDSKGVSWTNLARAAWKATINATTAMATATATATATGDGGGAGGGDSGVTHVQRWSIRQGRDVLGVFANNNFALFDAQRTRAVFPTVARLNHACVPSAQGNFNAPLESFTVHALRDIAPGEEITISYLHDELALGAARQARLRQGYGFECACDICAGPGRAASNSRRSQFQEQLARYHAEEQDQQQQQEQQRGKEEPVAPERKLAITRALIRVYEEEGLTGRELASLYSAAAALAVKMDDYRQAFELGARGLELERDAVGDDSPFFEAASEAFRQMRFKEGATFERQSSDETELSYAPWT